MAYLRATLSLDTVIAKQGMQRDQSDCCGKGHCRDSGQQLLWKFTAFLACCLLDVRRLQVACAVKEGDAHFDRLQAYVRLLACVGYITKAGHSTN